MLEKTGTHLWYPCPYEGFEGNDHVVYIGACPNQHIVPLLGYVLPRYGRDPMLIGSNYIWGWETNRIAREHIERAGGTVKGERFVPLGDIDIAHIIEEVRQKRPDFVLNTLIGPSSKAFVEAYAHLGEADPSFRSERRPIISCNWTESEIAALGHKATGHLTVAPYFQSIETGDNRAFLATTKRLAPRQHHVSAFFAQSYSAVHMIARGIAATGWNEAAAVLQHAKTDAYEAPFGATRIHAETNHAILTPSIGRATDAGQFEVVMTAAAPVLPDPYLARPVRPPTPADQTAPTHLRVVK